MDITSNIKYVYTTIPKEYVCVYHRILAMLADFGAEMLKDCKAACTDKNSGVIECFNMFNAAVAAYKLSESSNNSSTGGLEDSTYYSKLAETLIKYVKAKINQIYKGVDNSVGFVFPVDEYGEIKAFVSCGETVKFEVRDIDGELISHEYGDGFEQHFELSPEDYGDESLPVGSSIAVTFEPAYEIIGTDVQACIKDLKVTLTYDSDPDADVSHMVTKTIPLNDKNLEFNYYFDDIEVEQFNDVHNITPIEHKFTVVAKYNNLIDVVNKKKSYVIS